MAKNKTGKIFLATSVSLMGIFACLSSGTIESTTLPEPSPITEATNTSTPIEEPTTVAWEQSEHRIGIRVVDGAGEFYDTQSDDTFVVRGVNYAFVPTTPGRYTNLVLKVGTYDGELTRSDFRHLADNGYNTVRVFLDQCNVGPNCIGDADNEGLNPAYLANIADMMGAAKEAGIYILFTSNDLPDQGGYAEEANAASGPFFAGYRNSYYLTPNAVNATKRYWNDLLSGLVEQQADFDVVLGWQLLNEQWMFIDQPPLSLTSGEVTTTTGSYDMSDPDQKEQMVVDGLRHYIAEVKAEILTIDPTGLVTMGFFVPELVAPDWYVDTAPLVQDSELDFFDFHGYPGDVPLSEQAEYFGMLGFNEKPIVMGEYGAFRHVYSDINAAARGVAGWTAESCDYGFDGWLYWAYHPTNPEVGDRTWGLVDEDEYLLDLFAPNNHPDPCAEIAIETGNLAYEKPVRVSRALPGEQGASAVDEVETTQWGAGAGPTQWIEVDLQGSYQVTEIRLLVAQFPAGNTMHRILVKGSSGDYTTVHEFSQNTEEGDWLVFTPDGPIDDVQFVQIVTTVSPSWVAWKEIQVFGEPSQ
ncbi:MAG: hypothetical protein DWQ07_24530 [Chloroflexi bacterium]|nr:MAG: hypothetical protein DWQ07_24530 [Chloroflexota bacterium]MBL1196300.1 discoidin domain-containing protein [Chloroflexota bacterium]NOH13595.1 discoidin domain-containing protein [Chloroflexota bacterium]